jgi:AbrB family looped-hinge helix DNA binding protein
MALVKVRRSAQITLPAEVRRAYNLTEGDCLEVEPVEAGILLKPVASAERKRFWQDLHESASKVRDSMPKRGQSPKEEEEEIAEAVKAFRREHA